MVRKILIFLFLGVMVLATGASAQDPTPLISSVTTPKSGRGSKLHLGLGPLRDVVMAARTRQAQGLSVSPLPVNPALRIVNDHVVVDAVANGDANTLRAELIALGMQNAQVSGRVVSGLMPLAAMDAAEGLASLKFMRPAYVGKHAGAVTSQGDLAMHANIARGTFSVDGTGVQVGVLSDSYNCLAGAAAGVLSGDLPAAGVTVLKDMTPCAGMTDEGRAMLEIVHDVAPGSSLSFYTADNGQPDFANGIKALAANGAKVIVDDVFYYFEPYFQDGIIAQAVDYVKAVNGVTYFSAAGNEARQSYESPFRSGGTTALVPGDTAHNYDASGSDIFQRFSIPAGGNATVVLQWDSPFVSVGGAGSANDLDIYVVNDSATAVLFGSTSNNVGGDPVEYLQMSCPSGGSACFGNLLITLYAGPAPTKIKYIYYGDFTLLEYDSQSSTIVGHANAAGAAAVGAARYTQTPYYGVNPALLEYFSSEGTTPILFNTDGSAKATPEVRPKPQFVAPDGGDTTFFGGFDYEPNGFPNFFGTSAAAPHAAGVAALMLQAKPTLTPDSVFSMMAATALDMDVPGFDTNTGAGFIQADIAVRNVSMCDVNGDHKVDINDINLIVGARNKPASGIMDLKDWNHDGVINVLDARGCTLLCNKANCAP